MSKATINTFKLPASGFVRLSQLVPAIVPVSRSTFWRMVKRGDFPQPVKISQRITAWRNDDISRWVSDQS